jgi:putative component of toxin-antitoxin plasmid stabilization module
VKLDGISGEEASLYSIVVDDEEVTVFDNFLQENKNSYKSEIIDIVTRLEVIGNETGARIDYFKVNEGVPGDGVCALYDEEDSNLRLYCIQYGSCLVIIGGGGNKSKNIRSFQEDPNLEKENYFLRMLIFYTFLVKILKQH